MVESDNAETIYPLLLSRYRSEGMLGEGGLGTVVKAFDTRLKRMVAIKTLKRGSYRDDLDQFRALEERFAREAEAGSRMGSHPNLVGVHDLVIDPDRTQYLILEYIPGGTLAERIAQEPISLSDALRLTTDIAQGLQAAHTMGLVHRDIKPANIFLGADARAKVGDFGIAQIDDISGRTRTTSGHPGTPLYMSPEQERMTAYLRPASDQYSLGLVLFEMLTGQIYKRLGARQAERLLAEQPRAVASLVTRMIADDPDDRYPAMADVVRAIEVIERQRASAETAIPTSTGSAAPAMSVADDLMATRHDTPRIGLQPAPAVLAYVPPPTIPQSTPYSRRALLIGAGGLVLAAGTAGAAMAGMRKGGGVIATATLPATAAGAAAAITQPTATATVGSTATIGATGSSASPTPIIVTAPPIVITATPLPTAVPTATAIPTATPPPPPTATLRAPTAIPAPAQAQLTTWNDAQGRMQMTYPADWRVAPYAGQDQAFEVDSNDGVTFTVYISNNARNDSAMSGLTAYRDRQSKRSDRSYSFGALATRTIGGLSSASMAFTSISRQNSSDVRTAEVDYVVNGGWIFAFEFFTQGNAWRHWNELQAMLRSISF